jgi:predicted porin
MKKIVISALLAGLVSVASAQTVVTGALRYDFKKATGAELTTGITRSRIGVTTTEDLGGGMSVTAAVGLDGATRNGTVSGTDAFVGINSKMGSVMVGQIELGNGIVDRAYAGAPVQGADGVVLAAAVNSDIVKFTGPAVAGFVPSISGTRATGSTADHAYTMGVAGVVGPLDTSVDYNEATKRVRASAKTSVVGLTVGAGVSRNETSVADSWAVGASKAFGPVVVGAAYSDGNGKAKEVAAAYVFSKRTTVALAYRDVTENSVVANNVATTRVRLEHKF